MQIVEAFLALCGFLILGAVGLAILCCFLLLVAVVGGILFALFAGILCVSTGTGCF